LVFVDSNPRMGLK